MKRATVYERDEKLYVHSDSKAVTGIWVLYPPVLTCSKEDVAEIGRLIRQCLEASCQGIPHPKFPNDVFKPVLDLSGTKSFNTFMKSAKSVGVELIDEDVTLTPQRNEGPKGGYVSLPNKAQIALGSDEALGSAVVAALAEST